MKNKVLLNSLVMLLCAFSYAQTVKFEGKIVKEKDNTPIEFATVKLLKNLAYCLSDANGNFFIEGTIGDMIEVSHISFKTVTLELTKNMVIKLQQSQIELNEILVSANPLDDISQSTVINDATKRISQPRSVGQLFNDIQGFGITKKGAYASEPVFRSFKYEQLNVQYDGGMKVMNACPNRMDPITTHVIPEEIEKIEIIKGPFTVRFGQNFGGVINLVSKNPVKGQKGIHGSVEGGYESNGENLVSGASLLYANDVFDVLLNGSYRDFGNYKDGNETEVPSSFRTTDYSLKVGINPNENQRLQLTWRQSFGRDILHAGLPMDSPFDDSLLAGIDYKISNISQKVSDFTAKVFYSYVDHLMTNGGRPNFMMLDAQSPVEVWMYGGKAELVFTPSNNSKIFTGIDANLMSREGDRTRIVKMMNGTPLPQPKVFVDKIWQDATLNDVGVFSEGKFKVAENTTLTAGIRADFISTKLEDPAADFESIYGTIEDVTETNISANASLKYHKDGFQTQFAIGRGVRTASMIERYINHFTVGVDPYEYVGNPNLKPEVNTQIELSFKQHYKNIEIGGAVFHSFLRDYISAKVNPDIPRKFMPTTPPTVSKQFINLEKAFQSGIEFNFKMNVTEKLSFLTEVSFTKAENEDLNEPLPQVPPFKANLSLHFEEDNYWMSLNARLVSKQDRISESFMETETPGYETLDFRVGFTPFKGFTIGAAVLNIFDKTYYDHLNFSYKNSNSLSGNIYEPGRNFTTYLKYKF